MPVLNAPTVDTHHVGTEGGSAPKRRPFTVFGRVLLFLSVLAIVSAAIEFHSCSVMHAQMERDSTAEMTP
jgi:hypothetical protein